MGFLAVLKVSLVAARRVYPVLIAAMTRVPASTVSQILALTLKSGWGGARLLPLQQELWSSESRPGAASDGAKVGVATSFCSLLSPRGSAVLLWWCLCVSSQVAVGEKGRTAVWEEN